MKPIYFISDLHLAVDLPRVTQGFLNLLQQLEGKAHALYVLVIYLKHGWVMTTTVIIIYK